MRGEAARRGGEAKPSQFSQFTLTLSSTLLLHLSLSLSPDTSGSLSLYSSALPVLLLRKVFANCGLARPIAGLPETGGAGPRTAGTM